MPDFIGSVTGFFAGSQKQVARINRYDGFTPEGAIVLSDSRGTRKAEIPQVDAKGILAGDDPLAMYRPSSAKNVDAAKAMGSFTGWVYAAVNAIASDIANIQWRLYRVNGKDHIEVLDHPLLDLLDGVNENMTGIELKYLTAAHLELTGNAYWLLDGVNDPMGEPRAIHPLNPGRVRVKLDKSGFPFRIGSYEFTIEGKVYTFQPHQIVHLKYPDPNDPFVGIGIPQTIPSWIDSDNYAMDYNRKFFINGAQVGLYIQTDTNVEGNLDRIKRGFRDEYAGTGNAHKVPVLPKGTKLEHTGVTHKDMDFGNLAEATRDRILAAFRVSKTILGTAESDTNRSTAETADYVFSKRTIKPKMLLIVSYLNEYLVPRYGDDLYLTFLDPVPEDRAARAEEMKAALGGMPLMTQNEARRNFLGLAAIDGGDQLMAPSTMAPIGITETPEGEDQAPQLARALTASGRYSTAVRIRTGGKTAHSRSHTLRKTLSDAFKSFVEKKITNELTVKSVTELTRDEYMEHWKRFADRSDRSHGDLLDAFMRINREQKAEVLANLPDATGVTKALEDLFDLDEWIALTVDLATPILTTLAKDEAIAALSMIGAGYRDILADDLAREALDKGIAKMARSYNETTLSQLKEVLGEKLTQEGGTNLAELTEAVEGVYSFADDRRAGVIAQTESYRVANWANREAWEQSGVVKTVKWFTAEDSRVCALCGTLDGTEIKINSKFFSDSYADGATPPRHPSCRCYLRPAEITLD